MRERRRRDTSAAPRRRRSRAWFHFNAAEHLNADPCAREPRVPLMVVFQTAKLRRGVRMFRATRSTAGSRQIITILTTSSVFRAPGQSPTRSALLTPNWRGCEGTSTNISDFCYIRRNGFHLTDAYTNRASLPRTRAVARTRILTIDMGRFTVRRASLAPAMISTPGHRASRRRQRGALPAWSLRRIVVGARRRISRGELGQPITGGALVKYPVT